MRYLILLIASLLFSSDLIIQYLNLKKEYYENQIISLKLKIITPQDINLTFIQPLESEINVTKPSKFIYIVNLKYRNNDEIKKFFIIGTNIYKEITLNNLYSSKSLQKVKNFCNVLADNFKITNAIASKYNDKYNMLSFTIETKNANLKDFSLNLKDENLTIISSNKATFFGLIKKNINNLTFYYFNTQTDNYEKITVPINLKEETISTQTDLNPEQDTLFTPTNILILSIIALLIIIFLVYQKILLIIFPLLLSIYLAYLNLPKGSAYLKRGTKVYILPTPQSTVFYIAPIDTNVDILKKEKKYTKIKLNNKIGWVKNEDLK
jgi:hypothetical protein